MTIFGTSNSIPHQYANSNGIKFTNIGNNTTPISASIASKPTKTSYNLHDAFTTSGLKLDVLYSDGTIRLVTSGFSVTGYNMNNAGKQKVTVTYKGLSTSFTINVEGRKITKASFSKITAKTYSGKAITPSITITWASKKLKQNKDYTLTYKNNTNTGIASLKSTKSKTASLSIKKSGGKVTGYKIIYSTDKNFKKAKTVTTSSLKNTLKNLSSKKKLYVKVCAYKKVGKQTYYGNYSNISTVKVK